MLVPTPRVTYRERPSDVVCSLRELRVRVAEHDATAGQRQTDLAAVRVAGQREVEVARRRPLHHAGVVGEQQAQAARPAPECGEHRRQVVVAACRVVHTADLDDGAGVLDRRHLVGQQAHTTTRDEPRIGGLHERRLALAVVVVAEHAEDTEGRMEPQQLPTQLLKTAPPAGEVAGDEHEVRLRGQRQVHGLASGSQIEAGGEPGVEVRELHHGEAVERRVGVRSR